ncbi:putative Transposase-associated domain-containing protein [Helianthus annuus]|nr:putative Transposase-associated domain-containing protein [Helianthus annuus]
MNLDKSWTKITNKVDPKFIRGAIAFAKWAERYADTEGQIHCPCRNCVNARRHVPDVVADHIIQYGFEPTYNVWIYHGEHLPGYETDTEETNSEFEESDNESNDGVGELLDDAFPTGGNTEAENFRDGADQRNNPNVEKLFVDMMKPLYPGCDEFSVLGFLLELMNVKVTCKMTNVSMDMILNLFSRAFKDANLPKNHYEAKKYLRTLGLGYESIHACKHDCVLFWKENANLQTCPVCSTSRYEENSKGRKKPVKVLRYFPITSRLKRLYASRHTAKEMLWHDQYRTKEEGVLRHPADGKAWEHFDTTFPDFANDPRNVRLGLASDGFNPFGAKSLSYSMWPVVLIPYNMPPWKSMVDASFMLALLIPGKDSPGKDIDVFLRPLIDELKLLWDTGVETYDCESKQTFNMRAALLWTINDFPTYGYLSGWSTSGYKACPICNEDASSIYIRDKIAFVGHRRFLPLDHSWRKARDFNGQKETRLAPKPVNGDDCLRQLEHLTIHQHGKHKAHGEASSSNSHIGLSC